MEFSNGIRMTNEKYYMQRQQDRGKQSKKCNILGTTQTSNVTQTIIMS